MSFVINKNIFVWIWLILATHFLYSQTTSSNEFWTEARFNGTLNERWATEFDYRLKSGDNSNLTNPFKETLQNSYMGWVHYYASPRWKASFGAGYFENEHIEEFSFPNTHEWRFTPQGTYFFHKIGYTFSTRMRFEFRNIYKDSGDNNHTVRYRQQFKLLKPFNSKFLRKGVFYGFASEELFFQSSNQSKLKFLNRNRFKIGAGYLFTDDLHVELSYINEYQPLDDENLNTNIFSIRIIYNNLIKKIISKINSEETANSNEQTDD
ncbi:DUF2490 domain-containing protein [Flavobacterium agrisoli]|uniref:DUF2490 domain-containing protein n=1 Tax=Flavobacterium agrisoli TaxID=2793066 RepID=A0A934PMK1_9FLAO|nr:DUF2490 domain-containing protein [Flavobacterium agrisoli]MBK0370961.1 DUF2490 domain-containing protein [Flavobacterium agrisoli]